MIINVLRQVCFVYGPDIFLLPVKVLIYAVVLAGYFDGFAVLNGSTLLAASGFCCLGIDIAYPRSFLNPFTF